MFVRQGLEVEATAELQRASSAKAGDVAEGAASEGRVGTACELGVVEQIERLDTNLELAFAPDVKAAEDACVHSSHPWTAELVAVGVAEMRLSVASRLDRVGKRNGVKPGLTAADRVVAWRAVMAAKLVVGRNEIGIERIAGRVEP